MQKLFIFGIGGTGERVLRSLTMLLAAGVPAFDNYEIYPIIVDYDQKNADKGRTAKLLMEYQAIHNAAFSRHVASSKADGVKEQFFAASLHDLTVGVEGGGNFLFPFKPATENEKFRKYIGCDAFPKELNETEAFIKSLYDDSDRPDTELNLDMTVGFKGNPNIGSVVFNNIRTTETFKQFLSNFDPNNNDKVVIVGSLFGGTGASGIPEIAKAITGVKTNPDVAAILVLPYFAPESKKNGAIKASRFNSKTKAAVSFYESSAMKDHIKRCYYVGDFTPTTIPYSEGGFSQKNNANLVELVAAMMIENFVSGRKGISSDGSADYKFSFDSNIYANSGQETHDRLYVTDFDEVSFRNVLRYLIQLSVALKFVRDEIYEPKTLSDSRSYVSLLNLNEILKGGKEGKNGQDRVWGLISGLNSFYSKLQEWMKELDYEGNCTTIPGQSHRLAICDMERPFDSIVVCKTVEDVIEEEPQGGFLNRIITGAKSAMEKTSGNSRNNLDADFLNARMDSNIKDNGSGGHYDTSKNSLRSDHEYEWVLADILYKVVKEAFEEGRVKISEN